MIERCEGDSSKTNKIMANTFTEPPSFISDDKSMAEYEADVEMWSRLTSITPELQAEVIVFHLGRQEHPVKEKIMMMIGSKLKNNPHGIQELLKFPKTIYKVDDMAYAFEKCVNFEKKERGKEKKAQEFIADWEVFYEKIKPKGYEIAEIVLAFKLLKVRRLTEIETSLVLTGVDLGKGKDKGTMLGQVKESLRKFIGRLLCVDERKEPVIKTDNTFVTR